VSVDLGDLGGEEPPGAEDGSLFSDAEAAEDFAEDVFGVGIADDAA
jgi:hypothetical protein